ncbi:cytochrome c oxidase subunit II [Phenylobacterium hankyongense]|uniref:Cytochrome c oxidase subunit 2 n=1 Tax=Phenylobacterium hankyongense TaxID=1813876 RepID=A0A328AY57_9CAUL|nr:cytochrome c oxidase subunit II [Phenylobacterium hankyongense]RAK60040.1 cytochrome c oxidase subunit II [Phenylobacterium hankyongense]
MKSRFQGMRALATGVAAGAMTAFLGGAALAEDLVGQPTPGAIDLQPGVTPLRHDAIFFHNMILMPIITAITLFVAALLIWCIVRYNKRANPVPARWSHNTVVEVVWTLVPVLILVFISIFSFKLLFAYHDMPKPYMTVKATGYQWYWGYELPDQKIPEFVSNILPEDQAKAKGVPYRLAATEPLVVPVNKVVRVLVTGADVIHAFAVPSFGIITDAVPGRVNETWFKVEKVGTYYGQCRELCGVDHAFMPIEVRVVTQPEFDAWVASKGGGKPAPTPTTLSAAATPAGAPNAAAAGQPAAATAPENPAAPAAASTAKPAAPAATTTQPAPQAPAAH